MWSRYWHGVWNILDVYPKHWDAMLVVNIITIVVTIMYMALYQGYIGHSCVDGGDGEEYFIFPILESITIWGGPLLVMVLMAFIGISPILAIFLVPFLLGKGVRAYVDWINKPEPSPFVGQKLEAEEFEVHNDWKN
jgi:hypothetical protein